MPVERKSHPNSQRSLFEDISPAVDWDQDLARHALDELFTLTSQYRSSQAYHELMRFIARFHFYSPFNAMLVHVQMPGARFVAPPHRWASKHQRRIKAGARPLVILQPMGPVMFVFDVSDTEPEEGAPPLPHEIEFPFEVKCEQIGSELVCTIENAIRDGVRIIEREAGSQSAGEIRSVQPGKYLTYPLKRDLEQELTRVPLRYELLLNSRLSNEAKYATVVHELAHLYCGHLGTPDKNWWSDRGGLTDRVQEFEAESVCYLLCGRLGIDNPSEKYLAGYVNQRVETPAISLDCVLKAAGLIEQMGKVHLNLRKEGRK